MDLEQLGTSLLSDEQAWLSFERWKEYIGAVDVNSEEYARRSAQANQDYNAAYPK